MRKLLFLSIAVAATLSLSAQNRVHVSSNLKNVSAKKPLHPQKEYTSNSVQAPYMGAKTIVELQIGTTMYDLMTNSSVDQRIYLYPDGTIGAAWTFGNSPTAFPDRGTGYNYFDGSTWGPEPTARIETSRTGWGSYTHLGATGEAVVAHNGTQLVLNTRSVKGTGAWAQSLVPYPAGIAPTWPRACAVGNTLHVLAADQDAYFQGQRNPLVYYRSQDGGATWDIQAQIPAGLDSTAGYTEGYGGDVYSWAEPVNGTLAYVVGDNWSDLSLMKSTDNGNTWTKTIIFQHPYFNFNEATTLTPDTPYVCDGTHSVALDAAGNAHVAFGIMRVLNDDTTDAASSWFPLVDGIAVWNEGDPTLTDVNPDNLAAAGSLVAWVQDKDGSGVLYDALTDVLTQIPSYYISASSQPQLTIDQTTGDMFLIYKSFVENLQASNGQYFSHLWGRKFTANNSAWGTFTELTDVANDGMECVFPTMSKTMDSQLHLTYMMDFEPGLNIRGDADPVGQNSIISLTLDTTDLPRVPLNVNQVNLSGNVRVYPNPVANNLTLSFVQSTDVEMNIYNSLGAVVMSKNFTVGKNDSKEINLNNLSTGIYMVKVKTIDGTFTKKIIKE